MKTATYTENQEKLLKQLVLMDRAHFKGVSGLYCHVCLEPLSVERQVAGICECEACLQIDQAA